MAACAATGRIEPPNSTIAQAPSAQAIRFFSFTLISPKIRPCAPWRIQSLGGRYSQRVGLRAFTNNPCQYMKHACGYTQDNA